MKNVKKFKKSGKKIFGNLNNFLATWFSIKENSKNAHHTVTIRKPSPCVINFCFIFIIVNNFLKKISVMFGGDE